MSRVVAFRCSQPYLLVPAESALAWMAEASVEFLGDVETDTFGPTVASAIELQIATRTFAVVSKENFYFSRPCPSIAVASTTQQVSMPPQVVQRSTAEMEESAPL